MWVGFVAISAGIMSNGSLEVSTLVAAGARYIKVLAYQRKVGLRVIECHGKGRFLPRERRVAGIASLLEFAFVRIVMTIRAVGKTQSCIADLAILSRCVAALAKNITMLAG